MSRESSHFAADQWTDETFFPWLAGMFERGGHIRLKGDGRRIALVLSMRDAALLADIQQRVGAGTVSSKPNQPSTFVWKVIRLKDVERVLGSLLPFLTVTREVAYEAMDRLPQWRNADAERGRRNRGILALSELGHTAPDIATRLGTTQAIVNNVRNRWRRAHGVTVHRVRRRQERDAP